jgi:hypothetical protein
VLVYGYHAFPKPSVHGFPTSADPADRNCWYLVQPHTVPSMARLHGYQRPPRGGRGRCRRACERTPLRGRRSCAAGGRRVYVCMCVCFTCMISYYTNDMFHTSDRSYPSKHYVSPVDEGHNVRRRGCLLVLWGRRANGTVGKGRVRTVHGMVPRS